MNAWYASAFTGLFTQFGPTMPRPHDPACAVWNALAASWHGPATGVGGSGIGWTGEAAEAACVGEAIERLHASPLPDDEIVRASFDAWPLGEPAIDPAAWVMFHRDQYGQAGFPFQPLTRASQCEWVCFRKALTGQPRWIPAELAYLSLPTGHRSCPGYSTGLAAGRSSDPILLRGLQEVIERDAVVGAWWGRYPLEEYAVVGPLGHLGQAIFRANLTYRCFRVVTPFSDHVTLVTLEGEDREGYCFSIGSACRETRAASWEKALLEAIHGRHYVRYLKSQVASGAMEVGPAPRTFAEHAVFYSLCPELLPHTALSRARPTEVHVESVETEKAIDLIRRLGPERPVIFRSMTPPPLASERLDWHVLRVIVPGLQPLHGDHALPHLGGPLWSPRGLADWSAVPPHPFP